MSTVTLTSATHLRDASFSSYLNTNEETFVLKLTESIVNPSGNISSPEKVMYQAKKKIGYGEIGVFGAEKYFNGAMDDDGEEETKIVNKVEKKQQTMKDGKVGMHGVKPKTKLGTPSTCSEASWNSRSSLLPNAHQNREDKAKDNKNSMNSKKGDGCGEIYGKVLTTKPVPVEIKQTPPLSWLKERIPLANLEEEKARKSLEVFGSPIIDKDDIALNLEKKLAMLTWDANPRAANIPIALSVRSGSNNNDTDKEDIASNLEKKVAMLTWDANPRVNTTLVSPAVVRSELNDDVDSDSSSDLFEIKSLSSNGHAFFRRQTSDGMSGCVSPSYEPSEASIDWSVVTASAANFSMATDYDEPNLITTTVKNHEIRKTTTKTTTAIAKTDVSKGVAKRRPSMLLGCRSQKAVNVVGGAHRMPEKKPELKKLHRSSSFTPRSRFQTESKVTDFESAHAQRAFAKGSLPPLHSPRAVEPLYIA